MTIMKYYKILLFTFLSFILSFFTTFFSMKEYSSAVSSSCLECSYFRDVFLYSSFILIIIPILLFFLRKIFKKKLFFLLLFSFVFLLLVFFNNLSIFIDRVSSWSTFSSEEEIFATLSVSYLSLISSAILFFFILERFQFIQKNNSEVGIK